MSLVEASPFIVSSLNACQYQIRRNYFNSKCTNFDRCKLFKISAVDNLSLSVVSSQSTTATAWLQQHNLISLLLHRSRCNKLNNNSDISWPFAVQKREERAEGLQLFHKMNSEKISNLHSCLSVSLSNILMFLVVLNTKRKHLSL